MPSPRSRAEIMRARRRRAGAARAQRFALVSVLGVVVIVMLLLTAFSSGSTPAATVAPVVGAARLLPAGPPKPQVVATAGPLRLQLPVAQARVTAIGYHGAGTGALALSPLGQRGNRGLLSRVVHGIFGGGGSGPRWYQLPGGSGPGTGSLNVGALPGTDVYSPVDGTVVGISDLVISGKRFGSRIDIRPANAPGLVVSVSHLEAGEAVSVGAAVAAGSTPLGRVIDLSGVERLALARFTQDAGNHVDVEVRPAPSSAVVN